MLFGASGTPQLVCRRISNLNRTGGDDEHKKSDNDDNEKTMQKYI